MEPQTAGFELPDAYYINGLRLDSTFFGQPTSAIKGGRSGTGGIFAKIRRIGKVAMFVRRKTDGAALDCRLMTCLYATDP